MSPSAELVVSVSEFVALLNQTLEFAYPSITIAGELANFRVSKGRWVYFDLKDEFASVKFFGTVFQLPGPLEDGLLLEVRGMPQLHSLYGFSVNVQGIRPVGEGSIRRAQALLEAKLLREGLFDESRKRPLPYPPTHIGLITSSEAAAYSDFLKVSAERWGGLLIDFINVQVQGEQAVEQIVQAIELFNEQAAPPEVLVITRGGGSADDLAAFSTEQVTRAVAGSRTPTLVAIGHERDVSLAELAADRRASTPSNAAELLVPDKTHVLEQLGRLRQQMANQLADQLEIAKQDVRDSRDVLIDVYNRIFQEATQQLSLKKKLLAALNPQAALARGYAIIRSGKVIIKSIKQLKAGQTVGLQLSDGSVAAKVSKVSH